MNNDNEVVTRGILKTELSRELKIFGNELKTELKNEFKSEMNSLAVIINGAFAHQQKYMDKKFDAIDERFEKVEFKLDGLQNQMDGTNRRLDAHLIDCVKQESHIKLEKRVKKLELRAV